MSRFGLVWVLFACLSTSAAYSQVTIDVSKITCEQFLHNKVASNRTVAIWLSGYRAGQRNDPVVDTQAVERNAGKVTRYCDKNRNVTLMQAVEASLQK
ncbi:HdeA/HdeB family chaperone [Bradyrhizobium centrosematis]|uniref:HdeA/HdeB family chaperone n=1 Tax=Bradyrhizobium centrosematis TaxID=1300039 RepID=UPI0038904159